MTSLFTSLQSVNQFMTHLVQKSYSSLNNDINDFYNHVLNLDLVQQSLINKNKLESSIEQQEKSRNLLQNNLNSLQMSTNSQNPINQPTSKHKKNSFKINPPLIKLSSKLTGNMQKLSSSKSPNQLSMRNQSQSKQKIACQIRQIMLKKIQLKNQLKKLNSQLKQVKENQKSSISSFQSFHEETNQQQSNPEGQQHFLAKLKNSSIISNKSPSFNFSRIKSKSDAQLNLPRQSLKQKEAIYSPEKHSPALRLIQKFHSQKIKKHEKILNDMKLKQQRQIETLKKLQQIKQQEKQRKIIRQRILLTPKSTDSLKSHLSYSDRISQKIGKQGKSQLPNSKNLQKSDRMKQKQRVLFKVAAQSIIEQQDLTINDPMSQQKDYLIKSNSKVISPCPSFDQIKQLENEFLCY